MVDQDTGSVAPKSVYLSHDVKTKADLDAFHEALLADLDAGRITKEDAKRMLTEVEERFK